MIRVLHKTADNGDNKETFFFPISTKWVVPQIEVFFSSIFLWNHQYKKNQVFRFLLEI